ncbi:VG15 protein [Alloscardovia sp. HMSC034E08]|uniref:VG15 protein n=1 Tax=Alloscardovia sp. HMSC034E08 TaxID=1739413 RepID=UPI003F8CE7A0
MNLAYDVAHRTSNLTTLYTATKDSRAVRCARVPQDIACGWCVIIASHGFVCHSEDTAGETHKFHLHDNCLIIPSWGK